jgi:hypothetical protein
MKSYTDLYIRLFALSDSFMKNTQNIKTLCEAVHTLKWETIIRFPSQHFKNPEAKPLIINKIHQDHPGGNRIT